MKMSSQRRALARIYKRRGRYEIPALTSAETPRVEEGAKPDSSWRFSAELGNLLSPPLQLGVLPCGLRPLLSSDQLESAPRGGLCLGEDDETPSGGSVERGERALQGQRRCTPSPPAAFARTENE